MPDADHATKLLRLCGLRDGDHTDELRALAKQAIATERYPLMWLWEVLSVNLALRSDYGRRV